MHELVGCTRSIVKYGRMENAVKSTFRQEKKREVDNNSCNLSRDTYAEVSLITRFNFDLSERPIYVYIHIQILR